MHFSELSQDIQISSGGSVSLRCVTTFPVELCRWSLTPANSNTTVVVKQFPSTGSESRDCSVRLSHALTEQVGLWTCGAKAHGQPNYTDAPPAKLTLLEPGIVVDSWQQSTPASVARCRQSHTHTRETNDHLGIAITYSNCRHWFSHIQYTILDTNYIHVAIK